MNSKEDIKEIEVNALLEKLEQSDNPRLSDLQALLSDEESADDARMILEYRLAKVKSSHPIDSSREWKKFSQRIHQPKRTAKLFNICNVFYAVASVAAVVFIIFLFNKYPKQDNSMLAFESNNAPNEILMGDEEEDMEPIKANVTEEGIIVNSTKADFSKIRVHRTESETKTISTPRGKDYEVVLSDGTVVLLNADSKITFPTRFTGENRTVKLVGEAYFKVSKNKHRPFIVQTENLSTKVLGTEFNLKAYPHSDVNVTLIKGSVAVNAEGKEVMLKPGQNAEYNENKEIEVTTVDTECYTQWKDGYFYFDNVPLIDVVRDLGRWYNVNVEIRNNSLMSYRLHFIASRKASIKEFVDNLNEFNYLSVVHKDNKLIIDRKQ